MTGPERRFAPRVSTDLAGTLVNEAEGTCRVINISQTGALAISTHCIDEMNMVRIQVEAQSEDGTVESFWCEAAVVRCSRRPDGRYDLGLYFTGMNDEDRSCLARIVESGSVVPVT